MGELIFIGLGVYGCDGMSLKGLEECKKCDLIYAEFYTSKLIGCNVEDIEEVIGKKINVLERVDVEDGKIILKEAQYKRVGLLCCGDPMAATTHVDLRMRATRKGIKTKIIHSSSVFSVVPGLIGLQHYKFGRTVTLPKTFDEYFPTSPYELSEKNFLNNLHTLILLDTGNGNIMKFHDAMNYLTRAEEKMKKGIFTDNTLLCVVEDAGSENPTVFAKKMKILKTMRIDGICTLVLPSKLHFAEAEALMMFANADEDDLRELSL